MPGNEEILAALIDFRDFVAEKFEQTATKAELPELRTEMRTDMLGLRTEMRVGFDRVDRRLERLESRIEDLET
ncbi:MAG: hypothetical protein ACLPYS_20840 [Vulcanimicrobiaceae bacterium]|jgi:hypothetical protein